MIVHRLFSLDLSKIIITAFTCHSQNRESIILTSFVYFQVAKACDTEGHSTNVGARINIVKKETYRPETSLVSGTRIQILVDWLHISPISVPIWFTKTQVV